MKRMIIAIMAMLTITVSATAMSYDQARREALFLTDKMAYELNLTNEQYDAAYEINLDYLMGVTGRDDVFGTYWTRRNLDISYILLDWQWRAFRAATYFYRPLYWHGGYWRFGIYARYPRRDYFYFGIHIIQRRTQLAKQRRTQLLSRTQARLSPRRRASRHARQVGQRRFQQKQRTRKTQFDARDSKTRRQAQYRQAHQR